MKNLGQSLFVVLEQCKPEPTMSPLVQLQYDRDYVANVLSGSNSGWALLSVAAYGNRLLYDLLTQPEKEEIVRISDKLQQGLAVFRDTAVTKPGILLAAAIKRRGL